MKHLWKVLLLILPIAGIVLLVLSMTTDGDNRMLGAGLLCTSASSLLNLYLQRRRRKETEKHE